MSRSIASREKSSTIDRPRARRGQSMIEAMVAMTIIITSVSSGLALVQSSINASRVGGSQIIAANLAREGVEVARSVRDSDWLAGNAFDVGLTDASSKTASPAFDPATATWSFDFGNYDFTSPQAAVWQTPDGTYLQAAVPPSGSIKTPYTRLVTINDICRNVTNGAERIETGAATPCNAGSELMVGLSVESSVHFSPGGSAGTSLLNVEERLYDWR